MNKFTVLVTETTNKYIDWQMEMMYDSFLKFYKNEPSVDFLSVIITDQEKLNKNYPYFLCKNKSYRNFKKDDDYVIYDRAFSIKEYLETKEVELDRLYLFVEADFIFIDKFDSNTQSIMGQKYNYMNADHNEFTKKVVKFYMEDVNPSFTDFLSYYKPVGWPFLVKENILRKIINRWIELTVLFRTTDVKNNPLYMNWICDMYGFNIALAENKIIPEIIDVLDMPPFDISERNALFYHYCYGIKDEKTKKMIFDKRSYKPWEFIEIPAIEDGNLTKGSIDLFNRINNYAFKKKFNI